MILIMMGDGQVYFLSNEGGIGSDAFKRLVKAQDSNNPALIKDFYRYEQWDEGDEPFKPQGYQFGGSVSDATATSAMDELLAQAMIADALKKKPQSKYSMVDADRIGAEENEMMDMIMSMAIPGVGVAGTTRGVLKQLGKRALKDVSKKEVVKTPVKHLSKIAGLKPFKQKEKVLDKIASTMKVAPGRKVKQTPRDLYDWKGYKVLEVLKHLM